MRAYELQGQSGIDSLTLTERPEPRPGAGQVLVKMRAWSLNYRDLMVMKGTYHPKLRLPMTPLSDGVGEVIAVREGVSRVKMGERVAGVFMQKWIDGVPTEAKGKSALGGMMEGLAAEYVALDADGVVPVPEHLTDEEAASLPCAAVTAWNALVTTGNLKAGDTVLVQGTSGASAREITGGVGVDHVVEVGGTGTLAESLRAVRMGGRISLIGVPSGAGQVDPTPILMKNVRVQGIFTAAVRCSRP